MTACPKCGATALRVHGSQCQVSFRRRWPRFWVRAPRLDTVAVEASCAVCMFAFVVRESGTSDAPYQAAYESNRGGGPPNLGVVKGKGRESSDDESAQAPRKSPRPAPDPRNRPR